ncbi:MAG: hypothetical protein JWO38_1628 [Gemmataceae bacterium]|nr:hypothetical protein [Gemmataceae bacterium]
MRIAKEGAQEPAARDFVPGRRGFDPGSSHVVCVLPYPGDFYPPPVTPARPPSTFIAFSRTNPSPRNSEEPAAN